MCMALIRMLYYIIRAANRSNKHFHLLTINKNLQTPTCSLKVNEAIKQQLTRNYTKRDRWKSAHEFRSRTNQTNNVFMKRLKLQSRVPLAFISILPGIHANYTEKWGVPLVMYGA